MKVTRFQWGIFLCVLIVSLFLRDLLFHITQPLDLTHNDAFFVQFILKHYIDIVFSGNFHDFTTLPMLYGLSNTLLYNEHFLIPGILALPLFLITHQVITTYYLIVFLTMITASISMYFLAWHFTRTMWASVLASVIFVCNPYVFARFPDHFNLISLQWIPLIFLFLEKSLMKPTNKHFLLFFLFLTLQTLSSSYYIAFLSVILPLYTLIRWWQIKFSLKAFITKGFMSGLILFAVVVIGSALVYQQFLPKKDSKDYALRYDTSTDYYAAWPTDYLFTPSINLVYGGLRSYINQRMPEIVHHGIPSEENLFIGIVPFIFLFASFLLIKNPADKKLWRVFVCLFFLSLLLSFGTRIHFSQEVSLPGIFGILRVNPLTSYLRVEARFAVFVFFFMGLIAAQTAKTLVEKKKTYFIVPILIAFLLLEYWNKPLQFLSIPQETKKAYASLEKNPNIKVILELPIGNLIPFDDPRSRSQLLDAHYLLYATLLHNKKLFNGITAFIPLSYYEQAELFSTDFPSRLTLALARKLGIDAVVLHRDEFTLPVQYFRIRKELHDLQVPIITSTPTLTTFDLTRYH